jgi:hypothetical protein
VAQNRPTKYYKPRKKAAMREIRRMIIEGNSHQEIQRQLDLPSRSYFRYVDECFAEDRQRLAQSITNDEILNQISIVEQRLTNMFKNMHDMATNENVEPQDRIAAERTAGEIAAAILRIRQEAPIGAITKLRKDLPNELKHTLLLELQREL